MIICMIACISGSSALKTAVGYRKSFAETIPAPPPLRPLRVLTKSMVPSPFSMQVEVSISSMPRTHASPGSRRQSAADSALA